MLGPVLAIDNIPLVKCFALKFSSSKNIFSVVEYIDSPPFESISPPYIKKFLDNLEKLVFLKLNIFLLSIKEVFYPVHKYLC